MIERVARAIAKKSTNSYAFEEIRETDSPRLKRAIEVDTENAISQARVAIEAMMEPSNKMLHEAAKAMSPGRRPTPDRVSVTEKHKIRYQAMIREALK